MNLFLMESCEFMWNCVHPGGLNLNGGEFNKAEELN